MNKKQYAILNFVFVLLFIFSNYYIGMNGINGENVKTVSDTYKNLLTPATFTFGIWMLIFIGLIILSVNQIRMAYQNIDDEGTILNMGPWLILANIGSSLWMYFWVSNQVMLSVVIMVCILLFLMMIVVKLDMELAQVSKMIRWTTWAPISLYSGWITIALVVNFAAYFTKEEFFENQNQEAWAIAIIVIATFIYLYVLKIRKMKIYTLAGAWGLFGVTYSQWDTDSLVQFASILSSSVLILAVLYQMYQENNFNWNDN